MMFAFLLKFLFEKFFRRSNSCSKSYLAKRIFKIKSGNMWSTSHLLSMLVYGHMCPSDKLSRVALSYTKPFSWISIWNGGDNRVLFSADNETTYDLCINDGNYEKRVYAKFSEKLLAFRFTLKVKKICPITTS